MDKITLTEAAFSQYYKDELERDLYKFFIDVTRENDRIVVGIKNVAPLFERFEISERSMYFSAAILMAASFQEVFNNKVELVNNLNLPYFKFVETINPTSKMMSAYKIHFGTKGLGKEFKKALRIAKKFFLKKIVDQLEDELHLECRILNEEIDRQMKGEINFIGI